jgi:hypothetical protein
MSSRAAAAPVVADARRIAASTGGFSTLMLAGRGRRAELLRLVHITVENLPQIGVPVLEPLFIVLPAIHDLLHECRLTQKLAEEGMLLVEARGIGVTKSHQLLVEYDILPFQELGRIRTPRDVNRSRSKRRAGTRQADGDCQECP